MAKRNGSKPVTVKQRKNSEKSLANLKPFVKDDPRINRNGRPKTHDQLRELIQSIAAEGVEGSDLNRLELMIRGMLISKSAVDKANVLEHGWGKVTQPIELSWRERAKKEHGYTDEQLDKLVAEFSAAMVTRRHSE